MLVSPLAMMAAGFTFGLVHALDADHVMAVSALSNRKAGVMKTLQYCLSWALGHGGTLLLLGGLFFGLGFQLPESMQVLAEASVGVLLIVIGGFSLWRIRKQKLQLQVHRHGDVVHTHWHQSAAKDTHGSAVHKNTVLESEPSPKNKLSSQHNKDSHAPVMVGMLHGLAGSAPALALVPVLTSSSSFQGQLGMALAYLLVFSLGVLFSMGLFGLGLGLVQQRLQSVSLRLFQYSQYLIASASILFGGFWLSQSL